MKKYCIFCKAQIQPMTFGSGYKTQCPECFAAFDFFITIYPRKEIKQ